MPSPKKKKKTSRPSAKKKAPAKNRLGKAANRKPAARKRPVQKKSASRKTTRRRKRVSISPEREIRQEIKGRKLTGPGTGRQSGDLQGLSRTEGADSESVEELVEEGNIFEAGAVAGVEEGDNAEEKEVHTHEVPEDDVPEEYLDEE